MEFKIAEIESLEELELVYAWCGVLACGVQKL